MAEAKMQTVLEIPGRPVPKGRPRRGRNGRWYTPTATIQYEDFVAWMARASGDRYGDRDVTVRIELRTSSRLRGDLDNYAKGILDGLQKGGLFDNDRQVRGLTVYPIEGGSKEQDHVAVYIEEA
jgi:crossover junction endodeoxyribonuclease RusA